MIRFGDCLEWFVENESLVKERMVQYATQQLFSCGLFDSSWELNYFFKRYLTETRGEVHYILRALCKDEEEAESLIVCLDLASGMHFNALDSFVKDAQKAKPFAKTTIVCWSITESKFVLFVPE
jgi:hypothetical protein